MKRLVTLFAVVVLTMSLFATSAFADTKPFCESEPNNTQWTATATDFPFPTYDGMIVYGTCSAIDSNDFYKIVLANPDYSSVQCYTSFRGAPGCTYLFTLYDSNMAEWGHVTSTSSSPSEKIGNFMMRKGIPYYFEVQLISGTPTMPYRIYLDSTGVAYPSKANVTSQDVDESQVITDEQAVTETTEPSFQVEYANDNSQNEVTTDEQVVTEITESTEQAEAIE